MADLTGAVLLHPCRVHSWCGMSRDAKAEGRRRRERLTRQINSELILTLSFCSGMQQATKVENADHWKSASSHAVRKLEKTIENTECAIKARLLKQLKEQLLDASLQLEAFQVPECKLQRKRGGPRAAKRCRLDVVECDYLDMECISFRELQESSRSAHPATSHHVLDCVDIANGIGLEYRLGELRANEE